MKKILALITVFSAFAFMAAAQNTYKGSWEKGFITFSGGITIPINDFADNDINNSAAGMAEKGFNIEIKYMQPFKNNVGLSTSVLYGRNSIDKSFIGDETDVTIEPWEYYSVQAGPMFSAPVSDRMAFYFSVMSGASFVNSPKTTSGNTVVAENDWSVAVPIKLTGDLRINFSNSGFFFTGFQYTYMKPEFNVVNIFDEDINFKQRMDIIGFNAGIGLRF